jgi:hypothetical protein
VEGVLYNDYLLDYRVECLDKLVKESDPTRIHRLQGMLSVLDDLLQLRGEVDLYVKGTSNGTMRKIELEKENEHAMGRQRN